ncbi:uncharacterized protein LOC107809276 [Nicotiana tabacum]|uniref:Uncharacterized protein LOC107809276 n=1 Tax=Nicotiana tabacum TaxID=4097 RepID=A0AC58TG99_TOBAC
MRDMHSQGDGTQSNVKRGRGFETETPSEPAAPKVPSSRKVVSPRDRALTGVDSYRAEGTRLIDVHSAYEEVCRLHFMAFDRLRSELLHHGARLRKSLYEDRSLRLLYEEKEVELAYLQYEACRSSNYESYLMEQTTYQDKSTQTDENQESKDIFAILTTLSLQMDSMGNRLQQLESQQHDYKNAELSRSEDSKLPEIEGDVGKLHKTHDKVCFPVAAGTSKQVHKKLHTNVNLNNVFDKPFTSKKPKEAIVITPQTTTYANSLHHNKKIYNHITQTYIENIYKIQTFLNLNPRSTTTTDPTQDYVTQKLQGYNRLIAQPKTKANLVKTCYNYRLLSIVYTHDGEEIIGIPELYKAFVTFKRITKGNLFFIKFYTAPAEILYDEIKPIIQVIKIGLTRDMIIPEEIEQQSEIQKMEIPSFYANKRIIGIATIIQELANNYLQGNAIWSYYSRDQYCKLVGHKYPDHICSNSMEKITMYQKSN